MRKREIWDRLGPTKLMNALAFHQQDDDATGDELGIETEGGEGDGAPAQTIPLDLLPEDLRSLASDPEKLRGALQTMRDTATQQANQPKGLTADELARALRESMGQQPKEPEQPSKPVEELIYEDPRQAIRQVINEVLGPRIQEFETFAGSTTLELAGSRLPDFDQYQEDVQRILRTTGAPVNAANVKGAYLMVRGERAMAAETAGKQARDNSVRSTNGSQGDPNKTSARQPAKLTDDEREVMRRSGFKDEKEFIKHRDGDFDVAVPTGGK